MATIEVTSHVDQLTFCHWFLTWLYRQLSWMLWKMCCVNAFIFETESKSSGERKTDSRERERGRDSVGLRLNVPLTSSVVSTIFSTEEK